MKRKDQFGNPIPNPLPFERSAAYQSNTSEGKAHIKQLMADNVQKVWKRINGEWILAPGNTKAVHACESAHLLQQAIRRQTGRLRGTT